VKIRHQPNSPWIIAAIVCAVAFGIQGGFAGLADPDLPMHLALGEWIVQHRAIPFAEPFAWTRAGAPFYAYSWLPDIVFFQSWRAFGPAGLHVLMGATMIAIVAAGMAVGRAMKVGVAGALLLGTASAYIALESTPFLRPQLLMFVLVPLAWLVVEWLATERHSAPACAIVLLSLNALAANTHISFPVMAAPLALLIVRRAPPGQPSTWYSSWRVRTTVAGGIATVTGC
jgi:hypothetical protein